MPTIPGTTSEKLTPQQTLEKVAGLITEVGDESPETPEPAAPDATPAETTPPPESPATAEPTPEDETVYPVTVDGEETQVSLAELKKSYSYQAHNTQTAQDLAEQRKRLEPELRQRIEQEVAQDREQYRAGLAQIRQALEELHGEPDWQQVRAESSDAEFLKKKADWETAKAATEKLRREEQRQAEVSQAEQAKQYAAYLRAEEDKLKAAVPEWSDVAKGKVELAKLATFMKATYGIPDAQLANAFTSAAAILVARDAMKYRELHREPNAQAKVRTAAIKTASPGTPARPRPNAEQEKLVERTKSGRQRDAAAAIAAMLGD